MQEEEVVVGEEAIAEVPRPPSSPAPLGCRPDDWSSGPRRAFLLHIIKATAMWFCVARQDKEPCIRTSEGSCYAGWQWWLACAMA
jgi:hypothetical protein